MRRYPVNSPQAAARILALTVLADGDISSGEFERLARPDVQGRLGMGHDELATLLHEVYDDLSSTAHLDIADTCPVDEYTLRNIVAELDDPALQVEVLQLCIDIAQSDGRVEMAESIVIAAAVDHWGLQCRMLQPVH